MGTFTIGGNGTPEGLDPVLLQIIQAAAANSNYNVELFSSVREGDEGSRHQHGNAVDIVLIDPQSGEAIPNYNAGGAAFGAYEGFAQLARSEQMRLAPDRAGQFRWGGYFRQGGTDLMHFDFHSGGNMAYGSWDGGLSEAGRTHVDRLGGGQIYSSRGITDVSHLDAGQNRWSGDAGDGEVPWLRRGSEGEDVRNLQRFLNSQGARLEEDGDFGPRTERAVRAFQANRQIDIDGIVGPQTYGAVAGTAVTQRRNDRERFLDAHPVFSRAISGWMQQQIDRTGGPGSTTAAAAPAAPTPPPEFQAVEVPRLGPATHAPTPPNFMTPEAYRQSHPAPLATPRPAHATMAPQRPPAAPETAFAAIEPPAPPAAPAPPMARPQAGVPTGAPEAGAMRAIPPNFQTPEAYRLSHPQPLATPRPAFATQAPQTPQPAVPPQGGVPGPTQEEILQAIIPLLAGNGGPVPPNFQTPEAYRLSHPQPLATPRPAYSTQAPRR